MLVKNISLEKNLRFMINNRSGQCSFWFERTPDLIQHFGHFQVLEKYEPASLIHPAEWTSPIVNFVLLFMQSHVMKQLTFALFLRNYICANTCDYIW